jgi:zinc protease
MKSIYQTFALGLVAVGCGNTAPLPKPPPSPRTVTWPAPMAQPAEPLRTTPDAAFRDAVPEPSGTVSFAAPKIESFTLKNGTRVLYVARHELPIVSVRVVVTRGAGDDGVAKPGVMSFMGAMLEQGAGARNALQISDDYEAIGAQHGASVEWDSAGSSVKVLPRHLDAALAILGDVIQKPTFPEAEIARLKARRLAGLAQEKNSPGAMASNAVAAVVYGRAHPYGHSLVGREEDVKKITRDDLTKAYERSFAPKNTTIIVAGDVTKEVLAPKLEATFGSWKANAGRSPSAALALAKVKVDAPRLVLVDRPGAPQSQVILAEQGVAMSTPDRDALNVANAILGGMFSSRINMNLREAHAYTYGAYSRFSFRHGAGPFTAGGAVVADKTAPAIHELFVELAASRDTEATVDELANAKENLKLALPGRFETVTDVTNALSDIAVYDLPLDEFATRVKRIDAVTAADVKRVAAAHLHPSAVRVIVVGDRAKLESSLEVLHLGAPEIRDAFGDPIAPAPAKK